MNGKNTINTQEVRQKVVEMMNTNNEIVSLIQKTRKIVDGLSSVWDSPVQDSLIINFDMAFRNTDKALVRISNYLSTATDIAEMQTQCKHELRDKPPKLPSEGIFKI
jgi:citrate lyase alpha subunit